MRIKKLEKLINEYCKVNELDKDKYYIIKFKKLDGINKDHFNSVLNDIHNELNKKGINHLLMVDTDDNIQIYELEKGDK